MTTRSALDRTLRLMRDEVSETVSDVGLLAALTSTRVALIADQVNISSHSAQSAFVTAAMLMARSGHDVHLICPPVEMAGPQPPLGHGELISKLVYAGGNVIPGVAFDTMSPTNEVDLAIALGNSDIGVRAKRAVRINATPWAGRISDAASSEGWNANWWPLGAMAAAALAATEAFKIAIRKFDPVAKNPRRMASVFAPTTIFEYRLAPEDTPYPNDLGALDCVSGGAIINAVLFVLGRVPSVRGHIRVIEPEIAEITNLNRYMLLLGSRLTEFKAVDIARIFAGTGFVVEPVLKRYDETEVPHLLPLAPSVLVGVDDIPTRWHVQRADPKWLAVGATTHWSAMASVHDMQAGCAECLHPADDPSDAPIPTVAFVSFWAGLLTAVYFLRHVAARDAPLDEQQVYMTALRPDTPVSSSVSRRDCCPSCAMLRQSLRGKTA